MNKYQEALNEIKAGGSFEDLKDAFDTLQEVFHDRPYEEYNEAIDIVCDWIDDEETMPYVDKIRHLLYQIRMRKADADLLNKLRKITGTIGDLDLLNEVSKYRDCKNELCLKCGKYKEAHNGGCDGCKFN